MSWTALAFGMPLVFSVLYSISQFFLIVTFRKRHQEPPGEIPAPAVTVLLPVSGADPQCRSRWKSLYEQTSPPAEVRYGMDSPKDPAVSVAESLGREFPRVATRIRAEGVSGAPNRKAAKLAQMAENCGSPFLVAVDQDIAVPPHYLQTLLSYFSDSRVGLATSLYRIKNPGTLPSVMELLAVHADFFPSVLIAEFLGGGLRFAFGATLAVRREVLRKTGGFEALKDFLADDYELGARVWKAGCRVALSRIIVEHAPGDLTLAGYRHRQIRAGRTHRVTRPLGFALSVLTHGLPWSAGFVFFSGGSTAAWSLAGGWVFARILAVSASQVLLTEGQGPFWPLLFLPLHEAARLVFWFLSFTGSTVKWGSRIYKVSRNGKMQAAGAG